MGTKSRHRGRGRGRDGDGDGDGGEIDLLAAARAVGAQLAAADGRAGDAAVAEDEEDTVEDSERGGDGRRAGDEDEEDGEEDGKRGGGEDGREREEAGDAVGVGDETRIRVEGEIPVR